MRDLLIYGGGRLGRQLHHLASRHFADRYRIVGFLDDVKPRGTEVVDGQRVLGTPADAASARATAPGTAVLLMAIGYADLRGREAAYRRARELGYRFATLVHPRAWVEPGVHLGEGTVVLAGAIVDQGVRLGAVNYLDIGTLIGEDTRLGRNNYLAAGVTLGGGVTVGRNNFLGLDATVTNEVRLGDDNFFNAKSLVYRDVADGLKYIEVRREFELPRPEVRVATEAPDTLPVTAHTETAS